MRSIAIAALAGVSMAYDHWAVLVAGSNTYSNYRHQADVHHAYQILKNNGMPESNIILMSYDDIAQNYRNPFPGEIFNKPNGDNVYFQKDISYSGKEVTAANFLAVLKGDAATAGGPVLQSNSNSKVFVYFADHGAPGFVAMPVGGYLYADQIQDALLYMQQNNMYDELTFYMEACESGSMFPNLEASQKVYAMTAANASESSWGSYCGSDAVVDGVNIGSCLGDLFSVNWMQDTEANVPTAESLETQYENVKAATTRSHVQKFGDFSFMSEAIADFEGNYDAAVEDSHHHGIKKWADKIFHRIEKVPEMIDARIGQYQAQNSKTIDSRDINMHYLFDQYAATGSQEDLDLLNMELAHREKVNAFFTKMNPGFKMSSEIVDMDYDCLRTLVDTYETTCEKFSDYSLKYAKILGSVCQSNSSDAMDKAIKFMQNHC